MNGMKYIVVETQEDPPRRIPFIFPRAVNHDAMLEGIKIALRAQDWIQCSLISAGFVDMETLKPSGYSETLRKGPDKKDAELLKSSYS